MKNIIIIAFCGFIFVSCKKDQPNIELIQDMMVSPAVKAQDHDPSVKDGRAMRLPPKGSVARNMQAYRYTGKPEEAKKYLSNPFKGDGSVIERGEVMYATYCAVCHGDTGKGDGLVAPKMLLAPPSIVNAKIKAWTDAELFHIISSGRGVMGSYATQILAEDRWKLINYVRELQKK